ncbi:MAG TPA: DUF4760 domain-containing protein [Candidatus Acidoferrales bacterium]|nr:DUF4760 domain-containing protein [Candidatus Acidoferrales bacterium]
MPLELTNTLATVGTFVVIAATAIAAIVQLRHMRGNNQITALNELRETMETPDFQAASHFVGAELPAKMLDPAFRYQVVHRFARTDENRPLITKVNSIGNFYENMGLLLKTGLVEQELVMEMWSANVVLDWRNLAPITAMARRTMGDALWENFEYLAVLSQDWIAAHPKGSYPSGVRHLALDDEWLEADTQYATTLAPA